MNTQNIEFIHPEQLDDEVFFINTSLVEFQEMAIKTKRIGNKAYDGKGNQLFYHDWHPVFLKEDELIASGITLLQLRKAITNV